MSAPVDLTRDELVERSREQRGTLQGLGVTGLSIFGSRARSDNRPDSDLDVLLDHVGIRKFSLVDLVRVEHIIGSLLGLDVQVTTRTSVPHGAWARI